MLSTWHIVLIVAASILTMRLAIGILSALRRPHQPIKRDIRVSVPSRTSNRTVLYRTQDGKEDYHFEFNVLPDGTYRIYILRQPSYGGRCSEAPISHRLNDGRQYICWSGRISSEGEARAIAARWADATQKYIATGETIH